jgi:peptidoglycan hydrolase-like protein with peptidoglycan-binding domain
MKKFISSIAIIVFVFSLSINLVGAQTLSSSSIANILNSLLKANLIPAQSLQTAKSMLGSYSQSSGAYDSSFRVDGLSTYSGSIGTEVIINGSGFAEKNIWVGFEGVDSTSGLRKWNISTNEDNVLRINIPSTIYQTSEAYIGEKEVQVLPGKYQIVVVDENNKIGPFYFTVTESNCFTYTRDLTLGSTGADVVALQTFLESKGHLKLPDGTSYNGNPPTKGYFGNLTQAALSSYQTVKGISPADGYFGPVTRASVMKDCGTVSIGLVNGSCGPEGFSCRAGFPSEQTKDENGNLSWNCNGLEGGVTSICALPATVIPPSSLMMKSPTSGSVYDNGPKQNIITGWYDYQGDFDYYRVTLTSPKLGKDVVLDKKVNKKSNGYTTTSGKISKLMQKNWKSVDYPGYFKIEAIKKVRGKETIIATGVSGDFKIVNPLDVSVTLSVDPAVIVSDGKGGTVTLSWESKNVSYCIFEKERVDTSGSRDVYIEQNGIFTISCVGNDGSTVNSNPVLVEFILTSCPFTTDLTLGSTGKEVDVLQAYLTRRNLLTLPESAGYFGTATQNAIIKYQLLFGISPADGYFGPVTRASVCGQYLKG